MNRETATGNGRPFPGKRLPNGRRKGEEGRREKEDSAGRDGTYREQRGPLCEGCVREVTGNSRLERARGAIVRILRGQNDAVRWGIWLDFARVINWFYRFCWFGVWLQ